MASLICLEARDVDEQAGSLAGYRQSYVQLGRGRFHGRLLQLVMSTGVLFRESTNRHLRQQVHPPRDHIAIAVPLSVEHGSHFAGRALSPESVMVLTGDDEYEVTASGGMDLIGLSVHRHLIMDLAQDKQEWLRRAERMRHLVMAPDSAAAIRTTLLARLGQADGVVAVSEEPPSLERRVLTSTLAQTVTLAMSGEDHTSSIPRRAETRLRVVNRAVDFLRAHLHDDIGTAEICRAACASRRSLQYCFEEFLHTTPQAYLRALRLNEARRRLKGGDDVQITFIASELGFNSASHFTRQYRSMFDELPSETLRSARDSWGQLSRGVR